MRRPKNRLIDAEIKIDFLSRSAQVPEAGCWLWLGSVTSSGYGNFSIDGNNYLAHRASWTKANGSIPDGMMICHKCDVRLCVNPDHLFVGDAHDNMRDHKMKGRHWRHRQTHCIKGHPLSGENLRTGAAGRRSCIVCCRKASRESMQRARDRKKLQPL